MSNTQLEFDSTIDKCEVMLLEYFNTELIDKLHSRGVCNTIFELSIGGNKYAKIVNIKSINVGISISYINYLEF